MSQQDQDVNQMYSHAIPTMVMKTHADNSQAMDKDALKLIIALIDSAVM